MAKCGDIRSARVYSSVAGISEMFATATDEREQMAQLHSSNTTFQARALLGAFHKEDDDLLRQRLAQFKSAARPQGDALECERMELLTEIASELEHTSEPFGPLGMSVYKGLLEHLASIQPVSMRPAKAFTAAASGFQSKPSARLLQ
jgi:hypothetical protein